MPKDRWENGLKARFTLPCSKWLLPAIGVAALFIAVSVQAGGPPAPYLRTLEPGKPGEETYLVQNQNSTVTTEGRKIDPGQSFQYALPAAARDRFRLDVFLAPDSIENPPTIAVYGENDAPISSKSTPPSKENPFITVFWSLPNAWTPGTPVIVSITARDKAVVVTKTRYRVTPQDENGDGFPDLFRRFLLQGSNAAALTILRSPTPPYTVFQSGSEPNPATDPQTDAVFAYTSDAEKILLWKARGYTVWTMGGARAGKAYFDTHPGEAQSDAKGNPLTIEGSYYFSPTPNRIAEAKKFYQTAIENGTEGICPEEPEYHARAGYEQAFKTAWQNTYGFPWRDPASSVQNRWLASRLMAQLQVNHIAETLKVAERSLDVRKMVALHSPINYPLWNIVSPHHAITSRPEIQDVIGQVWTGTARTPIRYAGLRQDRTFSHAYLEYSSLYHLVRGTGKRLWYLVDPIEDNQNLTIEDYKSHYEQTVVAALLFSDVNAYEVMPWPERVYPKVPPAYATQINTIVAAMQDMHNQTQVSGNASGANIGIFYSDSMQWQREAPAPSDLDGFYGMALPLLQHGIPIQAVSLDRAFDLGYLKPFKTLLLSYDYQKPPSARTQAALASWVRDGGCLLFFGGSDPFNSLTDSWWKQAGRATPQADLFKQLGIEAGNSEPKSAANTLEMAQYQSVLKGDANARTLANKREHKIDLTAFAQKSGSVAVRFSDVSPQDGWGAWVSEVKLHVGGRLAATFLVGGDLESRFLVQDRNSQFNGTARFADGNAYWTYQFDNLPQNTPIILSVEMGNGFEVSAVSTTADSGHTLVLEESAPGVLARLYPRLRVGNSYIATDYPSIRPPNRANRPEVLFSLRSGGAPVWAQSVGKGMVINVGIAPGFFSENSRSAGLLRTLTRYGTQRVGGTYKESDYLSLRRGRYIMVKTFDEPLEIEGRTIDLFSPTLNVVDNREIPARSWGLLYELPGGAAPRIGFVSGRLMARLEAANSTGWVVRGPSGTTGVARLHAGGRQTLGARALDRFGKQVPVQIEMEGNTALVKYPNDPEGVVVRVGWD